MNAKETPEARVRAYLRARDRGKTWYAKADLALDSILATMRPGDEVQVGDKKYVLVDLFADRNKVFRAHGIGRYELQVLKNAS